MIRKGFAAAAAAWMACAATGALAQEATKQASDAAQNVVKPCLTENEVKGLFLVVAPPILHQVADTCAKTLPASAFLRANTTNFLAAYDAAGKTAWPDAQKAIDKLMAGSTDKPPISAEAIGPMIVAMAGPMIAAAIKPEACPEIDHVLTDLAPLPPQNMAGLVVTLARIGLASEAKKGKKAPFQICPVAG